MGNGRKALFLGLFFWTLSGCSTEAPNSYKNGDAPLFSTSEESTPTSDLGIRSRQAVLDTHLLTPTLSPLEVPAEDLVLNLFEDASFVSSRTRWTHLPNQGWSWHGVISDDVFSEVTLVQNHGVLSGNVRTQDGDYQIRTLNSGLLRIEEVDLSLLPEDDEAPVAADSFDPDDIEDDDSTGITTGTDTFVDILVVYTKAAQNGAGSDDSLLSEIDLAIAETNEGYTQSGVNHRLRLADAVMTDWDETDGEFDFYGTLVKATQKADGALDEIHKIRDRVGADEVVILVEGDHSYCGIAWLMTSPSASFSDNAFAVVARGCATGNYTFAHEIGHNMGSNHDRDNADVGAHDFSFGLQVPDAGVRSIMAYTCPTSYCRRINRWSNPDDEWKGYDLGVAETEEDSADNHKSLNLTASIVAGFRDVPDVTKPTAPEILAPAPGVQLDGSSVNVILGDVGADQYALTVGSTLGGADLGQFDMEERTNEWVSALPEDGRRIYIRGWARHGDMWVFTDASYRSHEATTVVPNVPQILTPAPGTRLSDSTVTFTWTESSARRIMFRIGHEPSSDSLGHYNVTAKTSLTVHDLPEDGSQIWVSLYAEIDGGWDVTHYEYQSYRVPPHITPAEMISPTEGSEILDEAQFRWTTPCDCTFILKIKNEEGLVIYSSDKRPGFDGGADISGLPRGGRITATLFTLSEGRSFARNYEYDVR